MTQQIPDDEAWLVVKRGLYYRPEDCGYTGIRDEAGRYTLEEAKARECSPKNGVAVTIVKFSEAPLFSKACWSELALAYTQRKLVEAEATIERLRAELARGRLPAARSGG